MSPSARALTNSATDMAAYLPLLLGQMLARGTAPRIPESSAITDQPDHVTAYDQVMRTKMTVAYTLAMELVFRVLPRSPARVVDLAPGPGHLTLALARALDFADVTGIDLSPGMVRTASANSRALGLADRVRFMEGNALECDRLAGGPTRPVDLVMTTFAVHHLPDLATVTGLIAAMERCAGAGGQVVLIDVARLASHRLTDAYVRSVGRDYLRQGLASFYKDFEESMYAAWTPDELAGAVPADTGRTWFQIVPRGLPVIQALVGKPAGSNGPYAQPVASARTLPRLCGPGHTGEMALARLLFRLGRVRLVNPNCAH